MVYPIPSRDSRKTVFLTGATGNMGREAVGRIAQARGALRPRILVRPAEKDHPVVRTARKQGLAEIGAQCVRVSPTDMVR